MSASTERLLIEITKTQQDIAARREKGQPVDHLEQILVSLNQKLEASNNALNESASVIKG